MQCLTLVNRYRLASGADEKVGTCFLTVGTLNRLGAGKRLWFQKGVESRLTVWFYSMVLALALTLTTARTFKETLCYAPPRTPTFYLNLKSSLTLDPNPNPSAKPNHNLNLTLNPPL